MIHDKNLYLALNKQVCLLQDKRLVEEVGEEERRKRRSHPPVSPDITDLNKLLPVSSDFIHVVSMSVVELKFRKMMLVFQLNLPNALCLAPAFCACFRKAVQRTPWSSLW